MPDLDRDIRSAGTLGITALALPTTTPHPHLHKQWALFPPLLRDNTDSGHWYGGPLRRGGSAKTMRSLSLLNFPNHQMADPRHLAYPLRPLSTGRDFVGHEIPAFALLIQTYDEPASLPCYPTDGDTTPEIPKTLEVIGRGPTTRDRRALRGRTSRSPLQMLALAYSGERCRAGLPANTPMWSVTPDTDIDGGGAGVKMRKTFREDYLHSGRCPLSARAAVKGYTGRRAVVMPLFSLSSPCIINDESLAACMFILGRCIGLVNGMGVRVIAAASTPNPSEWDKAANHLLFVLPTGGTKTSCAAEHQRLSRGTSSFITAHRFEDERHMNTPITYRIHQCRFLLPACPPFYPERQIDGGEGGSREAQPVAGWSSHIGPVQIMYINLTLVYREKPAIWSLGDERPLGRLHVSRPSDPTTSSQSHRLRVSETLSKRHLPREAGLHKSAMRFDRDQQFPAPSNFPTRAMSCEAWRRELGIGWCISGGLHSSMITPVLGFVSDFVRI
ncbi:uncharacterized protein CLUP02_12917 [Colletotrichum lupini]|uniref:Uncharacterized protein n=1 Tax=Colletotrichum lupini TaxID=145971 RepID=A0A9Q8WLP3_9PEZI|nr:uncharacterized protein CLUP02_12917 [Colletotrichum lupini]UQC87412.1 hypothetical protein CLUP02_12917 [Colletotrichum lupini]